MSDFFTKLFSSDFIPHGHCYLWRPEIVWLHVVSDAAIALAYYFIPFALWYFIRRRKDLAFDWMFGCFAAFILACGTTHALQIWTLWHGTYRLEGLVKALTAGLSLATAALLIPLVPKAIRLPSPQQLRDANEALAKQILERERAEAEVRALNAELERRVEQRTAALKRSNEELAQFAYVASHDLQEPLRMVSNFTGLLRLRYRGKLDATADQYIDFASGSALRMHDLIQDLLSFSRIDGVGEKTTKFRLDAALDHALEALQLSIAECGAQIVRTPLPEIIGHERQFAQLFQNLIGNSIKYRADRLLEIVIGAEERENDWVISVEDNGIGFDPAYREKVFDIFQRLNGERFAGTGIGLAIVRKIVTNHGGQIWCDSKPGEGATFTFTLPKRGSMLALAGLAGQSLKA